MSKNNVICLWRECVQPAIACSGFRGPRCCTTGRTGAIRRRCFSLCRRRWNQHLKVRSSIDRSEARSMHVLLLIYLWLLNSVSNCVTCDCENTWRRGECPLSSNIRCDASTSAIERDEFLFFLFNRQTSRRKWTFSQRTLTCSACCWAIRSKNAFKTWLNFIWNWGWIKCQE